MRETYLQSCNTLIVMNCTNSPETFDLSISHFSCSSASVTAPSSASPSGCCSPWASLLAARLYDHLQTCQDDQPFSNLCKIFICSKTTCYKAPLFPSAYKRGYSLYIPLCGPEGVVASPSQYSADLQFCVSCFSFSEILSNILCAFATTMLTLNSPIFWCKL